MKLCFWLVLLASMLGTRLGAALETSEPSFELSEEQGVDASGSVSVLIVFSENQAGLAAKLEAEFSAWDFRVERLPVSARGSASLPELAARAGTTAAIRVSESGTRIELWISKPNSADTAEHETFTVAESGSPDMIALRAAETLRGRLVELGIVKDAERTPASVEASATPEKKTPEKVPERERPRLAASEARLWLGVAPVGNYASSELGISPAVLTALRFELRQNWALEGFALWPATSATLSAVEGSAEVLTRLFGTALNFKSGASGFHWELGAGLGLFALEVHGEAKSSEFLGQDDTVWRPMFLAHAAFSRTLLRAVRVRADAYAGMSSEPAIVRFDQRDVANFGQPLIMLGLGIEFGVAL